MDTQKQARYVQERGQKEDRHQAVGHFPPEYRRAVFTTFWIAGRFIYEFALILWNTIKWFEEKLIRIATYWQTIFLTRDYGRVFAAGGLFSILMALGGIPEFLIIVLLLILIPFIFAVFCAGAARAVLEFIYLFFKFMPPLIWVPVVTVPLGIAVVLAAVRTAKAWEKRKEMLGKSKIKINSCSVSCWN